MASPLKQLAGATAIYGLSSIVGRFLNYLLTPLYTSAAVFSAAEYGIITELYAYVAFLVVLLTYGMETAFFRFLGTNNSSHAFGSAWWSLVVSSAVFAAIAMAFSSPISNSIGYGKSPEFIGWFAIIVAFDALTALPMAWLRARQKAKEFALINLAFIGVNIGLNLFYLAYCLPAHKAGNLPDFIYHVYNPSIGVGYVFIANLVASAIRMAFCLPIVIAAKPKFQRTIWLAMLRYGWPLLLVGMAGIVNETLDRALLKWLLWDKLGPEITMQQLGIYGACYKLSIVITLFIQAYRYAAEPFFFKTQNDRNAPATYARAMHVFIGLVMTAFLLVSLFIDVFKYFIPNEVYWSGLHVVPVLLLANVCLGAYYNLSVWYKLTDKTIIGSGVALLGAAITVVLNLALVPYLGYTGSAWATLACYLTMAIVSWRLGKKHYPVPYNLGRLALYVAVPVAAVVADRLWLDESLASFIIRFVACTLYALCVAYTEGLFKSISAAHER